VKIPGTDKHQAIPLHLQQGQKLKANPGTVKAGEKEDKVLWEAAKDFEAMFMSYIIKTMQESLPEGNLTQNGLPGVMFNRVMGKAMVEGGGIGMAEIIYRDLRSKGSEDSSEKGNVASPQNLIMPQVREEHDDKPSQP